jgi:hypothetical protein
VEQVGFLVSERCERTDDPLEQPVGEPRIPREHRTVEIRPNNVALDRAVGGVTVLGAPPTQWSRRRSRLRDAAMILETYERADAEHAVVNRDVADKTLRSPRRARVKQAESLDDRAVAVGER